MEFVGNEKKNDNRWFVHRWRFSMLGWAFVSRVSNWFISLNTKNNSIIDFWILNSNAIVVACFTWYEVTKFLRYNATAVLRPFNFGFRFFSSPAHSFTDCDEIAFRNTFVSYSLASGSCGCRWSDEELYLWNWIEHAFLMEWTNNRIQGNRTVSLSLFSIKWQLCSYLSLPCPSEEPLWEDIKWQGRKKNTWDWNIKLANMVYLQ